MIHTGYSRLIPHWWKGCYGPVCPAPSLPRQPKEGTGDAALCPGGCILLRRCQADAAWAWAGVQRGCNVPPHPSPVAALHCRSIGLLLLGCVLPGTGGGRVLLPPTA